MADIFGTATSGLQAYQRALSTAGHNIANANTPGYSRQRVELTTRPPQLSGTGYIGSGVQVDSVRRVYDQFLTDRVRTSTSSVGDLQTFAQFSGRVADLLGDADAGLNGSLENFFNAAQGVANDPSSIPARQLMLSEAESLATRFQYLDAQVSAMRKEVNDQLATVTAEINGLSRAIADINKDIVVATGRAGGQPPNDLLDQRDQLLEELSGLVSITTLAQDDGSVNVFVGNGQALVTGGSAATLDVAGGNFDVTEKEIVYSVGGSAAVITDSLSGGKLGGLLRFREEILDPAQNSLGRVAVVLGTEFNAQHAQGMDLDGTLGGAFFSLGTPGWSASSTNAGSGTLAVSYDPDTIGNLTTKDYILRFEGGSWTLSDTEGNAIALTTGSGTTADPYIVDGLRIAVDGLTPVSGDRFQIRPTRDAGEDIGLVIDNVRAIAAAAPVRIDEATTATGMPINTGDGVLRFAGVDGGFSATTVDIDITYNAGTFTYTGSIDGVPAGGSFAYNPATDSGSSFNIGGVNFTVTGTPADGDGFTIDTNTDGSGDNTNALALAGLQTALTVENGTTNFQGAYAQMISDVGTRTRQAEISHTAQQALQRQAVSDRAAVAGVNLDEEAANLLRFQQAYQAMAQVVTAADSMFQTLLNAVRR
ncbi:MAG: flagellar hook-associated protein FlgK [Pseudomonadota bacterium]